jgi:hypothetical protein
MKLRTTSSQNLQRHLQTNSSRNWSARRGICIQCRRQLRGQNSRLGGEGTSSRSGSRKLVLPTRRTQRILPVPIITGQRRTLATAQNGTHVSSSYVNSSNLAFASQPRRPRSYEWVRWPSYRRTIEGRRTSERLVNPEKRQEQRLDIHEQYPSLSATTSQILRWERIRKECGYH